MSKVVYEPWQSPALSQAILGMTSANNPPNVNPKGLQNATLFTEQGSHGVFDNPEDGAQTSPSVVTVHTTTEFDVTIPDGTAVSFSKNTTLLKLIALSAQTKNTLFAAVLLVDYDKGGTFISIFPQQHGTMESPSGDVRRTCGVVASSTKIRESAGGEIEGQYTLAVEHTQLSLFDDPRTKIDPRTKSIGGDVIYFEESP